jgi:hypothetical protein
MTSQVSDGHRTPSTPHFRRTGDNRRAKFPDVPSEGGENASDGRWRWDRVIEDHALALLLPSLGIVAIVFLFIFAILQKDGKELLGPAVVAVSTLAAASGGHAAGRAGMHPPPRKPRANP